jgi:predicted SAM-dependent methyltransferase
MKLHLGCGKRFIAGFFHMDALPFPHLDRQGDIGDLSFLPDGSATLIYCCHAFEYFDRQEAATVLREWRRVLRSGGVLRLAVPDFEALARLYLETGEIERILGPVYGRIPGRDGWRFHRTGYDFQSLARVLETAGFRDFRRYDWRETEHAGVDDFSQAYFPHMDKSAGRLLSLNVEAVKP